MIRSAIKSSIKKVIEKVADGGPSAAPPTPQARSSAPAEPPRPVSPPPTPPAPPAPPAPVAAAAEPAPAAPVAAQSSPVSPSDDTAGPPIRLEDVQSILDDMVRPALQGDGGDITLIKVEDNNIYVKLVGSCSTCPSSIMTMKMGVEALLKEEFPSMRELIQVG